MKNFLKKVNGFIVAYPMVAIGLVIAFFVAIWYFFLRNKSGFDGAKNNSSNLKLDPIMYKQLADELEMTFHTVNDDEAQQLKLLRGLNKDELIEVFNQFGLRNYFMRDQTANDLEDHDLIYWFKHALNESEQKPMAEIWKETGLWY